MAAATEGTLDNISKTLASSPGGAWLEKISKQLESKGAGGKDPFMGFKVPALTDVAKGLFFGLAPGLIKKSVSGMQTFVDALNNITIPDAAASLKIAEVIKNFSDAIITFGDISWAKAFKGTFLIQSFANRFIKIGEVLGAPANLLRLEPFRKFAARFGTPLALIGDALESFSDIKWISVFTSTIFLKKIMKSLQVIGEVFVGSEQTFEKMGQVMEKLTEPLIAFGEAFKQIGNTLLKASVSLLIVAASLGLAALSLKSFAGMPSDAIVIGTGTLIALMTSVALLSKISKEAIMGAAALTIVSASLGIAALSLKQFTGIKEEELNSAGIALLQMVGTLVAVGAIMATGVGGGAILAGAGALGLVGLSLIPFAAGMAMLGGVNWKGFEEIGSALLSLANGVVSLSYFALVKAAVGIIPFAASMALLNMIKWDLISTSGEALILLAEGVGALSFFALAKAALGLIPFAAGIVALKLAIGADDKISSFLENFNKGVKELKGDSLFLASKGILALSGALVAFAGTQVLSGIGNLIGKILTFGTDSPIDQLIKLAKHGYNLSILGAGVKDLASGLKTLTGIDNELNILTTLSDKFKVFDTLDPTGIKAFAEGLNLLVTSLTALSQLEGKLSVLNDIPYDKLKSLSESITIGTPLIQMANGLQQSNESIENAERLRKGIASNAPTTGSQLRESGASMNSHTIIVNNNGGNVTNNSSTSSNVNNNGSINTPIITASGSGMFTAE